VNVVPGENTDQFTLGITDLVARPKREPSADRANERRLLLLVHREDGPEPTVFGPAGKAQANPLLIDEKPPSTRLRSNENKELFEKPSTAWT
jgi:hypothetical protein